MTFSKYACWRPEMVRKVMDVEATQPEDHIFLSTHYPIKMYRQGLTEGQSKVAYDEEQFLQDFLATPGFAFVPVLGTSGTGKSHLIRWLYTRIRSIRKAPNYRVLLIPKVGTNLRDIIGLILKDMEGDEFDEYRNRLERVTNSLTEPQAREQLLSNLAIAIGPSGKHDRSTLSEIQNYLVDSLPALLFDPFFRKEYWLKEGSIIQNLIVHALGHRDSIEIVNERRQFSLDDLPRDIKDSPKASAQARDFYNFLIFDPEAQKASVDWLNDHLDEAISQVLNLGRDLLSLMLDVRRALALQDIELILLIEDFAKLQGIDREVLEAVLAKGQDLCAMRTALACTEGYFKTAVDDTVQTRTDFSVNLDVKTVDEQSLVTPADVQQLAVRYLNAVRLQESDIREWLANTNEETGEPLATVPSACTDCEHQFSCHAGFGAVDGMGLYPFNATALEQMRERTSTGVFNPRTLTKDVLRHTLEYHRSDLEQGRFPSTLLLDHFGGSKLSGILKRDVGSKDTLDNAPRREALLNLWTNGHELRNLPPEVHTAFDLPELLGLDVQNVTSIETISTAIPSTMSTTIPTTPTPTSPIFEEQEAKNSLPTKLIEELQTLDSWQNGNQLAQDIRQKLRELIYPSISMRIDWATEIILKKAVIGQFFLQRNIKFFNAAPSTNPKGIELRLPLGGDADLRDTAIAFQAMLLYKHYKNWGFTYQTTHGSTYYRIYASKLEEWSKFVLQEVSKYATQSRRTWDPVPAVVELLGITGRMAGCPTTSLEDLINAVFTDLEKVDVANRSGTWQKLFISLRKHQPKLREILESRIPCTKGGSSRLQVIDAVQLVGPLKAVASTWKPQVDVSDVSADSPFDAIGKARKDVDGLLELAIKEEKERHLEVYRQILKELGEDFSQEEVVEMLQQTVNRAREAGVARGVDLNDLNTVMEEFQKANLKAYIINLKKLQGMDEAAMLLPLLSSLRERPVEVITQFLDTARKFVDKSQEAVQSTLEDVRTTGGGELEECYQAIERSLEELQQLASEIKGESPCS